MSSAKGKIIIISAPSGAGKGTLIKRLLELCPELIFSISATTRLPRAGEKEGVSYYYVSRECFFYMITHDEFLEYAEYVGEYYGTPKKPVYDCLESGKNVLLDIEVQGASQVKAKAPEAVTIFVIPPDMRELERRLRGRGTDSEDKLAARLERARIEMSEKDKYDYIVVNDYVSRAAGEILSIIFKERI
jgi:guanylate kinase